MKSLNGVFVTIINIIIYLLLIYAAIEILNADYVFRIA